MNRNKNSSAHNKKKLVTAQKLLNNLIQYKKIINDL